MSEEDYEILALDALLELYFNEDVLTISEEELFRVVFKHFPNLNRTILFWVNTFRYKASIPNVKKMFKSTSFIEHFILIQKNSYLSYLYIICDKPDRPQTVIDDDLSRIGDYVGMSIESNSINCLKWYLSVKDKVKEDISLILDVYSSIMKHEAYSLLKKGGVDMGLTLSSFLISGDIDICIEMLQETEEISIPDINLYLFHNDNPNKEFIETLIKKVDIYDVIEELVIEYKNDIVRHPPKGVILFLDIITEGEEGLEVFNGLLSCILLYYSKRSVEGLIKYVLNHKLLPESDCIRLALEYYNTILLSRFLEAGGDPNIQKENNIAWLTNRELCIRPLWRDGRLKFGGKRGPLWRECKRHRREDIIRKYHYMFKN